LQALLNASKGLLRLKGQNNPQNLWKTHTIYQQYLNTSPNLRHFITNRLYSVVTQGEAMDCPFTFHFLSE
jgi:hypothetical protein